MSLASEALLLPDGLDKLLQIQYVLGFGDGKISDTHIRDTPTQNKLVAERDRLSDIFLQNQKSPSDIEKIKKYERLSKMSFLFENDLLFVTPEEFKRFCRLERDIQHRDFTKEESEEYNKLNFKICDCLNLYHIQEKEIQQLKETNKKLIETQEIIPKTLLEEIKFLKQDSKTNAEKLEKIQKLLDVRDQSFGADNFKNHEDILVQKLQSILKESKNCQ